MKKVIILNKKEGETPLEALEKFRSKRKAYKDVAMTYAGRLDPMASGKLLILSGDEVHNKDKYLALNKEYEFEVLFGFSTDTHDILGKVINSNNVTVNVKELKEKISPIIKNLTGSFTQPYPQYSSKPVDGKPLFEHAREGRKVALPTKKVQIYEFKLTQSRRISGSRLYKKIEKRIKKVKGDFRQDEILKTWNTELEKKKKDKFILLKFKVLCSSGTYVRVLADKIGEELGAPTLAFSIKRISIML